MVIYLFNDGNSKFLILQTPIGFHVIKTTVQIGSQRVLL